ncbi:unnamed protein product [Rhodiola kirilowii]
MSQLATSMFERNNKPGQLPSQTIQNPKENVNAVTLSLRSGKTRVGKPLEQEEDKDPRLPGEEQMRPESLETLKEDAADKDDDMFEEERDITEEEGNTSKEHRPSPVPRTETPKINATLPFPVHARVQKQHVMDEDVFELFSKVEINIPLLEAIKQIPRYAKFLKELCTNRRRSTKYNQELMSRNVSAVIQRKVPPKCGDPGTYTIPCTIGNIRIENCMLDLGASINVLPFSIYSCLRIGPLEPTGQNRRRPGSSRQIGVSSRLLRLKNAEWRTYRPCTHPSWPPISQNIKNEDRLWKWNALNGGRRRGLQL